MDQTIEIFGILIYTLEHVDYDRFVRLSCVTTQNKKYGIQADRDAYKHYREKGMVASLLRQCQQDWVVTLEVTYEP